MKYLKGFFYTLIAIVFSIALSGCDASNTANIQGQGNKNSTNQTDSNTKTELTTPAVIEQQSEPKIETKDETKIEEVSFSTQQQNDSTLEKGKTSIKQEGKNGIKEIKFKVTYTDGVETSRIQVSNNITVQPIPKIVLNGTKIISAITGDGYTNIDGNHIESPSSDPVGATARCGDGTYSYSQHRSGTCSHHGGVAQWL